MNHYKKRFIKSGIVIPIIAAVIVTALFFAVIYNISFAFPSADKSVILADYEKSEIITPETLNIKSDEIKKEEIPALSANTLVGTAKANGQTLELIFNANDVNAVKKLNISENSKLIGETGCVFATCYKQSSDFVKSLKTGDKIELQLFYGNYEYEVIDIKTNTALSEAEKSADGISRAFVICTDDSSSVGISNQYLTAVCKMTDGKIITQ